MTFFFAPFASGYPPAKMSAKQSCFPLPFPLLKKFAPFGDFGNALCPHMIHFHTNSPPSGNSWCLSCCARQQPMLSWPIPRRRAELQSLRPTRRKSVSDLSMPKWLSVGAKVCLGRLSKCVTVDSQMHYHRWFWGPRQVQNISLF